MANRKILIADDSATQRELARSALHKLGIVDEDIEEAHDGRQALERIDKGDVDVALLDITMPDMDGLEVLAELGKRGMLDRVSVVMVTAIAQKRKIVEALKAGAKGYVIKPVTEDALAKNLAKCIEGFALEGEE